MQMWICGQNQPSDAESIKIHVSLKSRNGNRVLLASMATYTNIPYVCIANLIKTSQIRLMSIQKQR